MNEVVPFLKLLSYMVYYSTGDTQQPTKQSIACIFCVNRCLF